MKNSFQIAGGVVGAILGFVGTLLLLELVGFDNRADPIASALLALLVIAPIGSICGLLLGIALARQIRARENSGTLLRNSFKAFVAVIALCAAAGTAYYVYAVNTATPWLNANGATPILMFEVRLPAGTALPKSPEEIRIDLQTDINTMPGAIHFRQFRRDGDEPVIVGEVELAFRTAHRQIELRIKGQPDRLYRIDLTARAPHTPEFGTWRRSADGSEIRYRAKWAGQG